VIDTPDWRSDFVPAITTATGAITTLGAVVFRDKLQGNTYSFTAEIPITTNGTGAGTIFCTTRYAARAVCAGGHGYQGATALKAIAQNSVARIDISTATGTYPGADGVTVRVSGQYEIP
jgi:hypothetical protein